MADPIALTLGCFLQAAAHQGVPAPVMWGLYAVEGGSVGSSQTNADGSHDLGPMQINDRTWVAPVARLLFNGDEAAARDAIQWNGCFNAEVAAWVFHRYVVEDHGDLAAAVGHYNSHNPASMRRYQQTYEARFLRMYGTQLGVSGHGAPPPAVPAVQVPAHSGATARTVDAYLSGGTSHP